MLHAISIETLSTVTGGADQPPTPPPGITGRDVANTAWAATSRTLNPRGFLGAVPQAVRQFNDPRIRDAGTGTRLLNGALGVDPLK